MAEVFSDVVCNTFGGDEDEDLGVLRADLIEVLDELVPLFEITADFDDLLDVGVGGEFHGTNVDLEGVPEEVLKVGEQGRDE